MKLFTDNETCIAEMLFDEFSQKIYRGEIVGVPFAFSRAREYIDTLEADCSPQRVLVAMEHLHGITRRKKEYRL